MLGKRGRHTDRAPDRLGSSVDEVLRGLEGPVCLVSRLFLPISRAIVLIDSRPEHRRAVEFIASNAALRALQIDVALVDDGGTDPGAKLDWARRALSAHDTKVFGVRAQDPHETAMQYFDTHGSDLLVISREVLIEGSNPKFEHLAPGSLWSHRAPVLVC